MRIRLSLGSLAAARTGLPFRNGRRWSWSLRLICQKTKVERARPFRRVIGRWLLDAIRSTRHPIHAQAERAHRGAGQEAKQRRRDAGCDQPRPVEGEAGDNDGRAGCDQATPATEIREICPKEASAGRSLAGPG